METIQIKQLSEDATLPKREHDIDAGLDIFASEDVLITRFGTVKVTTGIAVLIPPGYEGTIRPRSGKTSDTALRVQIGTIDAGYDGEISVICDCHHKEPHYMVKTGEKIAQLVISPIVTPKLEIVDSFDFKSDRGSKGFGSSDEKVSP